LKLLGSFLLLLLAGLPTPAAGQQEPVNVRVDGRALFRVGPLDTLDALGRARQVERRIERLLQQPDSTYRVGFRREGERLLVVVSGAPVVTVAPSDAEENLTTVEVLGGLWARAVAEALSRGYERRLSGWSRFGVEVQGAVQSAFGRVGESALTVVPRALAAMLVLGLFWGLAAGLRRLLRVFFRHLIADQTTENLIRQVAYYAVWALGLLVALGALGFEPEAALAGLGLTSLALGFALKDILSNFVSGLLILGLRPFEIGDQIVVGEAVEGAVERIELRATQLRTYDGRIVLVPNAEVFTSRLTNNTAAPIRRGGIEVWVGYGEDLRRVEEVLLKAARKAAGVLEEPPVSMRVQELGASDVRVEVRFWSDSRRSDVVATASAVRQRAVEGMREAGIGLPDPAARIVTLRGSDSGPASASAM
jgi:small-conductance mechanosensitive channel